MRALDISSSSTEFVDCIFTQSQCNRSTQTEQQIINDPSKSNRQESNVPTEIDTVGILNTTNFGRKHYQYSKRHCQSRGSNQQKGYIIRIGKGINLRRAIFLRIFNQSPLSFAPRISWVACRMLMHLLLIKKKYYIVSSYWTYFCSVQWQND